MPRSKPRFNPLDGNKTYFGLCVNLTGLHDTVYKLKAVDYGDGDLDWIDIKQDHGPGYLNGETKIVPAGNGFIVKCSIDCMWFFFEDKADAHSALDVLKAYKQHVVDHL